MTNLEKAKKSLFEAEVLLRGKPIDSTLVERYFLLYEAWEKVKGLPQPLQMGKGLAYVLSKATLPIAPYDLLLGRFEEHVPNDAEKERLYDLWQTDPNQNPIVNFNVGHVTTDSETLVKVGIVGYLQMAKEKLEKVKNEGGRADVLNYLEGMVYTYAAICDYIKRYGEAAKAAGQEDLAQISFELLQGAPKTFRQALQLILYVYNVYLIYAGYAVACLNVGRLDDILLPLYLKDLERGVLTEEDAGCLIDDFSAKMSLHLGRGEHQMANLDPDYKHTGWLNNPVYESPGYITIGGYSNHCDHGKNPLTKLFARHIDPKLKNPVYVFRCTKDMDDELMQILSQKVKENSSILIYNDETVINAHRHIGVSEKEAVNYSIHPCNWADIDGSFMSVANCGEPLPMIIDKVLHSGKSFKNIDEIYDGIKDYYGGLLRDCFNDYRQKYRGNLESSYETLSLSECFLRDAIENAGKCESERLKYPAVYVFLRNIGTATDMLSAVDSLVFKSKKYTLEELVLAADNDFENCPDVLNSCKKAPKYGQNNELADTHAVRLMSELLDLIDFTATNENGVRDVYTLNVTINDSNHLHEGAQMNATVDGRRKGAPLTENLSPTVGCSKGVTAVLNSVSKLPFGRIHSGALNLKIGKSVIKDGNAEEIISSLIKTYFAKGGMQLQFSITDTAELKKAQENPDAYRDLLVRITGYSAVFVDISKEGQNEFIRRQELE